MPRATSCTAVQRRRQSVKNYTSISCHSFLSSPPPPVAEHAKQLAQNAKQGADQIKVVEHRGSPMMRDWTASSGQGGMGYMTGLAARAVPETGPLTTTPGTKDRAGGCLLHRTDRRRLSRTIAPCLGLVICAGLQRLPDPRWRTIQTSLF